MGIWDSSRGPEVPGECDASGVPAKSIRHPNAASYDDGEDHGLDPGVGML